MFSVKFLVLLLLPVFLVSKRIFGECDLIRDPYNEDCSYYKDSYIIFVMDSSNQTLNQKFQFTTRERKGLTSFGWSRTDNITEESYQFVYISPGTSFVLINNSFIDFNFSKIICSEEHKIEDTIDIILELPKKNLYDMNYTLFSRNENFKIEDLTGNFSLTPEVIEKTLYEKRGGCFLPHQGRIEVRDVGVFIIFIYFYIIAFILMIVLRNIHPFKSRGYIPYICLAFHILNSMCSFLIAQGTFQERNSDKSLCIFWAIGSIFLVELTFITPLIVYLRYLLVINMNNLTEKTSWKYKMLKVLASPFFQLFIFLCYLLYLSIHFTWIFAIDYFRVPCNRALRDSLVRKYVISGSVVTVLLVILQIYDIIKNWSLIKKCEVRKYFLFKDPFYFRIEIILTILLFLTYTIIYLITEYSSIDLGNTIYLLINSFYTYWLFFNQIGFSLIITLYLKIKSLCSKEQEYELDVILNNQELCEMFEKYAKDEWNHEILYAKLDLISYRKSKNKDKDAMEFREKYLNGSMLNYPLPIDNSIILQTIDSINEGRFDENLFDELEDQINLNLKDILTRFKDYPEFVQYERNRTMKHDLLSSSGGIGESFHEPVNETTSLIN